MWKVQIFPIGLGRKNLNLVNNECSYYHCIKSIGQPWKWYYMYYKFYYKNENVLFHTLQICSFHEKKVSCNKVILHISYNFVKLSIKITPDHKCLSNIGTLNTQKYYFPRTAKDNIRIQNKFPIMAPTVCNQMTNHAMMPLAEFQMAQHRQTQIRLWPRFECSIYNTNSRHTKTQVTMMNHVHNQK